jgi:hypothetical protein
MEVVEDGVPVEKKERATDSERVWRLLDLPTIGGDSLGGVGRCRVNFP